MKPNIARVGRNNQRTLRRKLPKMVQCVALISPYKTAGDLVLDRIFNYTRPIAPPADFDVLLTH
jgi:hypothetical protein